MRTCLRGLAATLLAVTAARAVDAQTSSRAYGVSGGVTALNTPLGYPRTNAPMVSGWFEFGREHGLAIETRMFLTGANATPVKASEPTYTRDLRVYVTQAVFAAMVEPGVTYSPLKLKQAALQPFAGLGATFGMLQLSQSGDLDVSQLDVDAGIVGSAGIRLLPARRTSIVARGSYRKMIRDSRGAISEMGLSGPAFELGLRFRIR